MSAQTPGPAGACERCLRRSWLLAALSSPLEFCCRDRTRLLELIALPDEQLLAAIGGRRRQELTDRYERFAAEDLAQIDGVEVLCRHDRRFPRGLNGDAAPHALSVAGGADRLARLTGTPVVALLGSRRASDYGLAMAKSLGRGLAASGVTVASGFTDGIALAAHGGALEARCPSLALMGGGLAASCPAARRSLFERIARRGCVVSELPCDCPGRLWGQHLSERIVAGMADIAVVVEAEDSPRDLAGAQLAQELGRPLAAVPGRVTSQLARGSHALLMAGAALVRGPQDVLELLCAAGSRPAVAPARSAHAQLEPRLCTVLQRVGAGVDTADKLTAGGADSGAVLMALSELELLGLLARGDGGRYVPREATAGP